MSIIDIDKKYVAPTYNRFPLELVKGEGSLLFDSEGKEYIDMGSGIGVTSFGSCDKEWQEAVKAQMELLQHTSNLYYTEPCALLAKRLCELTGMSKVFFGNSGAEANECAIKVARKYAAEKKGEDCYNIITIKNSFHGRTIATLSATGQEHYHELFKPLLSGFYHTEAENLDELKALVENKKIAAIMFECVQGEGGVIPLSEGYVKGIAKIAEENDILLICDEVQTGNGRTGKMYAYMNYGISPDIVTTAKGLGGGLPIGAAILSQKVDSVLGFGDHGSTYGGNPVCAAAALSIVNRITPELLKEVKAKSDYIFEAFKNAEGVDEISGMGLMIGIKPKKPLAELVKQCMERGVLPLTAKDKLRLLPALNIPEELLKRAVGIIKDCLK